MIRYALKCPEGHGFESWFQSSSAFDAMHGAGHVACPVCGSKQVDKALMAPAVGHGAPQVGAPQDGPADGTAPASAGGPLSTPRSEMEQALAALRRQVEENSDYVGMEFAAQARSMHAGDIPDRAIYGEARPDEARALIEEGVPIAPLPFMPPRKVN